MSGLRQSALRDVPRPLRYAAAAAVALGLLGGVVGLVLGLSAHPPTAWAAVIELGAPAGYLGALIGLVVGMVVSAVVRLRRGTPLR